MRYRVRWHPRKGAANLAKHGVSFDEASEAMADPLSRSVEDRLHSLHEDRFALVGETLQHRLVVAVYTIRNEAAWLIHAHAVTPPERRRYMTGDDTIGDAPLDDDNNYLLDYGHLEGWIHGRHKFDTAAATVTLDPDVFTVFRTSEDVNTALRALIAEGRVPPSSRD
jgi:uncharacterized DUF497 family protein